MLYRSKNVFAEASFSEKRFRSDTTRVRVALLFWLISAVQVTSVSLTAGLGRRLTLRFSARDHHRVPSLAIVARR